MKLRRPYTGEERVIRKFAIFPVASNGEIRWFETVVIHQSYNTKRSGWNNDWFE